MRLLFISLFILNFYLEILGGKTDMCLIVNKVSHLESIIWVSPFSVYDIFHHQFTQKNYIVLGIILFNSVTFFINFLEQNIYHLKYYNSRFGIFPNIPWSWYFYNSKAFKQIVQGYVFVTFCYILHSNSGFNWIANSEFLRCLKYKRKLQ